MAELQNVDVPTTSVAPAGSKSTDAPSITVRLMSLLASEKKESVPEGKPGVVEGKTEQPEQSVEAKIAEAKQLEEEMVVTLEHAIGVQGHKVSLRAFPEAEASVVRALQATSNHVAHDYGSAAVSTSYATADEARTTGNNVELEEALETIEKNLERSVISSIGKNASESTSQKEKEEQKREQALAAARK